MHDLPADRPAAELDAADVTRPQYAAPTPSAAEIRLRSIVALAADAIISVNDRYEITLFNAAAERIFGYERGDALGQPLDMLLPEWNRAAHRDHLEAFRHGSTESRRMGERGHVWGRRRSGELFPAEASISRLRLGETMHFTAVLRDVTEQRRAEQEREELLLRQTEAREAAELAERRIGFLFDAAAILHSSLDYERTFESVLRLIVPEVAVFATIDVVEASGRIKRMRVVHADPTKQLTADRLRAYPRDQRRYLTRHAIVSGEAEIIDEVTDAFLVATAEDETHLRILRDLAPTSFMVVPLRTRERVTGAVLLARDAHSPAYDDADLRLVNGLAQHAASALDNARLYDHAQRAIHARDDVLAIVSHDLRTPLSVISMCASSVLADGDIAPERTRERMRTIRESLDWADRLIRDLLDVSAIEAGGLSLTRRLEDPVLLVSREVHRFQALADEHSITLRTELPDELPDVEVDADRIMQALGNLIGNALKFTPVGSEIRVGAAEDSDGVRFYVADAGPGVPLADLPRVFDRFWTARHAARTRGTGMGLAVVRGIAEAHGGRASVANTGHGATFDIWIPLPIRHPEDGGSSDRPTAAAGTTRTE